MKSNIAFLTVLVVLASLAVYLSPAAFAADKAERHPKIHHAITALEAAKAELKAADHDFGGHRVAAIKECDAAIEQLKLALQYDKN